VRYNLTARENIWFGDVREPCCPQRLAQSAQATDADRVIAGLEERYDTVLGRAWEQGKELSIGQWQRVALSRAFYRRAEVLVLDEPTSAIDARTEYELFERFRELAEGRTVILISHRLATVKMADLILVLEGGRVIERGTHHELTSRGGLYSELYQMQARAYADDPARPLEVAR
jgi:ATP-binding cassette subfamily B protein